MLQSSYVNESKAAIDNKNDLAKLENDLKSIPIAGNLSLYDWCTGLIGGGESIAKLLSERADADMGARREASKLCTSTIRILGRFRAALADALAAAHRAHSPQPIPAQPAAPSSLRPV